MIDSRLEIMMPLQLSEDTEMDKEISRGEIERQNRFDLR